MGTAGNRPIVKMTAKEFMFGYATSLVTLGNSFFPGWIKFNKLGLIDRVSSILMISKHLCRLEFEMICRFFLYLHGKKIGMSKIENFSTCANFAFAKIKKKLNFYRSDQRSVNIKLFANSTYICNYIIKIFVSFINYKLILWNAWKFYYIIII